MACNGPSGDGADSALGEFDLLSGARGSLGLANSKWEAPPPRGQLWVGHQAHEGGCPDAQLVSGDLPQVPAMARLLPLEGGRSTIIH